MDNKSVVVVVHFPTYAPTLLPLATELVEQGWNVSTVFYPPVLMSSGSENIKLLNVGTIYSGRLNHADERNSRFFEFKLSKAASKIWNVLSSHLFVVGLLDELVRIKKNSKRIRNFLVSNRANLIIMGGVIADHDMNLWIKVASENEVKTLVIPAWVANELEPTSSMLTGHSREIRKVKSGFARSIQRRIPEAFIKIGEEDFARMPLPSLVARKFFNILPKKPWILHSGGQTRTALQSKAQIELASSYGLNSQVMVETGTPELDDIARAVKMNSREEICTRYNLDPGRPIVLWAVAPDMFEHRRTLIGDFHSHSEFFSNVSGLLEESFDGNVLYSLHPSLRTAEMEISKFQQTRILNENITNVLPFSDLYVATISATIAFALALGIPILNFDFYRYRYLDYVGEETCLYVEQFSELKEVVNGYVLHGIPKRHIMNARWGRLDGLATARIIKQISSLTP